MNKSIEMFATEGYVVVDDFLNPGEVEQIDAELIVDSLDGAGDRRFLDREWCRLLAHVVRHRLLKRRLLHRATQPVSCTYFAKTLTTNWSVGLHRDLHVPLFEPVQGGPWRNWSKKQGIHYAQAPREILESMLSVRIHLDECLSGDGGLCVVPGSQSTADVDAKRVECVGSAGSAVVLSPLLLHASVKATSGTVRRVLYFLFGPTALPDDARWYYLL